jgi:hypothetical protein
MLRDSEVDLYDVSSKVYALRLRPMLILRLPLIAEAQSTMVKKLCYSIQEQLAPAFNFLSSDKYADHCFDSFRFVSDFGGVQIRRMSASTNCKQSHWPFK